MKRNDESGLICCIGIILIIIVVLYISFAILNNCLQRKLKKILIINILINDIPESEMESENVIVSLRPDLTLINCKYCILFQYLYTSMITLEENR